MALDTQDILVEHFLQKRKAHFLSTSQFENFKFVFFQLVPSKCLKNHSYVMEKFILFYMCPEAAQQANHLFGAASFFTKLMNFRQIFHFRVESEVGPLSIEKLSLLPFRNIEKTNLYYTCQLPFYFYFQCGAYCSPKYKRV